MLYFAYGSNLSHEQMKERCKNSKYIKNIFLEGYKLSFCAINRNYGAANIVKKPRYIVAWFGTAICESLSSDIIPITLGKQFGYDGRYGRSKKNISQDFNKDPEMVYPIFKRSINWHKEQKIIYDLLDCKITYLSILSKLKLR